MLGFAVFVYYNFQYALYVQILLNVTQICVNLAQLHLIDNDVLTPSIFLR